MSLYPLKFNPIYKEKIWGGKSLESLFHRSLPADNIGESWEIADYGKDVSIVSNGPLAGKSLNELGKEYKEKLLGTKLYPAYSKKFPLLIKLLDANDMLSVQVHPDDHYAKQKENEDNGKTEMWIILKASENASIIYGLEPGTTRKDLLAKLQEGKIEECLHREKVKTEDVIFIPAGTVHAILPKLVIMEVQQNSDITYRLFDWNRIGDNGKHRDLHIDKALDVINFDQKEAEKITPAQIQDNHYSLIKSSFFSVERIKIKETPLDIRSSSDSFTILFASKGEGAIGYDDEKLSITAGEFILIPACLTDYSISGHDLELIKIFINQNS